jgi:excinuclease ABC subunit B
VIRETVRSQEAVAEVISQYSAETRAKLGADGAPIRVEDIPILIDGLEKDMKDLAKAMEFEKAATVRDEIQSLRALLGTADGRLGSGKRKLKRYAGGR